MTKGAVFRDSPRGRTPSLHSPRSTAGNGQYPNQQHGSGRPGQPYYGTTSGGGLPTASARCSRLPAGRKPSPLSSRSTPILQRACRSRSAAWSRTARATSTAPHSMARPTTRTTMPARCSRSPRARKPSPPSPRSTASTALGRPRSAAWSWTVRVTSTAPPDMAGPTVTARCSRSPAGRKPSPLSPRSTTPTGRSRTAGWLWTAGATSYGTTAAWRDLRRRHCVRVHHPSRRP